MSSIGGLEVCEARPTGCDGEQRVQPAIPQSGYCGIAGVQLKGWRGT